MVKHRKMTHKSAQFLNFLEVLCIENAIKSRCCATKAVKPTVFVFIPPRVPNALLGPPEPVYPTSPPSERTSYADPKCHSQTRSHRRASFPYILIRCGVTSRMRVTPLASKNRRKSFRRFLYQPWVPELRFCAWKRIHQRHACWVAWRCRRSRKSRYFPCEILH